MFEYHRNYYDKNKSWQDTNPNWHTVLLEDITHSKHMKIIDWLYKHQYKPLKAVDKIQRPNFYRVRLTPPKKYKQYTTKILNDGIELILGWY